MKLDLNAFKSTLRNNTVSVLKYLLSKVEEKPAPVKQEPVKQEPVKQEPVKTEEPKLTKENMWATTKDILNPKKDPVLNTLLENLHRDMTRASALSATIGGNASGNIATLNKVLLPVTSRGVRGLANLRELVAFQAMTGPVSQIHTLRVREDNGRLSIQVLKEIVEAKTKRCSARWTFEPATGVQQEQQGVDIEAEIMAALSQEITAEIEQNVLSDLRELATKTYFDLEEEKIATFIGANNGDLIIRKIVEEADVIGKRTHRGPANWVVVTPKVHSLLKSSLTSSYTNSIDDEPSAGSGLKLVGYIDKSIKVFVDRYASDDQVILLGYKGTGEIDSGYYYCPYVFLTSSGVIVDPQTLEPAVSFMTRFGSLPVEAQNYYTAIKLGKEEVQEVPAVFEAVDGPVLETGETVETIVENTETNETEVTVETIPESSEEEKKDTH